MKNHDYPVIKKRRVIGKPSSPWEKDDPLLFELVKSGRDIPEIAKILKRTEGSVDARVRFHGLQCKGRGHTHPTWERSKKAPREMPLHTADPYKGKRVDYQNSWRLK